MPRLYGSLSPQTAAIVKTKDDLLAAIRNRDEKAFLGLSDAGDYGFLDINGTIRTNKFDGLQSYLQAGTKNVWASAKAVDIVANVIISTEMMFAHRDTAKRERKVAANPNPELVSLLTSPNPHDTISELLYLWVAHMKFTGNAFWLMDEMDGYGRPKALYALNPSRITIQTHPKTKVAKYLYKVSGGEIEFLPEEIIHWRRPHANNSQWGLGEIEQGEALYDDFINRVLYNVKVMENGGMPSSVLVREEELGDNTEWQRMKDKFNEAFVGRKNAGKLGWLNGKWSLLNLGLDAQKLQDLEKSKMNVEQIFLNHGVPLSVAGFGAANYATSRQDRINMRSDTCLPMINWFCDKLNRKDGLISKFNPELLLTFSLSGLIDREQVAKECEPMVRCGAMTPNQFRVEMGYEEDPNPYLNQYFIQGSLVPIDIAGISDVPMPGDTTKPSNSSPAAPATPPDETTTDRRKKGQDQLVVNIQPTAPSITLNPQPSSKVQRVVFERDEHGRTTGAKLVSDDKAA